MEPPDVMIAADRHLQLARVDLMEGDLDGAVEVAKEALALLMQMRDEYRSSFLNRDAD